MKDGTINALNSLRLRQDNQCFEIIQRQTVIQLKKRQYSQNLFTLGTRPSCIASKTSGLCVLTYSKMTL